ncbi:MAG: hypothetical protein GXO30_04205 [Epsilonproteobacteria bacterium]|nr:hypothetical protein [Campylobacterota bacterium]
MIQLEIMKKKIKEFRNKIGSGLKQEYQETKDIPKHIKNGNYKEAGKQIFDIGKMAFIVTIWILPAGAIISSFIMKLFNGIRPSSFQDKDK